MYCFIFFTCHFHKNIVYLSGCAYKTEFVLFHCLKKTDNNIILNFKRKMFHVPSFFFISFYFIFPIIRRKNTNKMILRLERLLIPYLFWPLITYAINNLLFLYFKRSRFNRLLSLYELFEQ